jgi:hypothetical protein
MNILLINLGYYYYYKILNFHFGNIKQLMIVRGFPFSFLDLRHPSISSFCGWLSAWISLDFPRGVPRGVPNAMCLLDLDSNNKKFTCKFRDIIMIIYIIMDESTQFWGNIFTILKKKKKKKKVLCSIG